ncbi:Mnd1 HTH domain-containing protein [Plasmodiophora brassicae]
MSSKKKGLSHDEKRKRMCEFFYEKKEVMVLKELEKQLPKVKGIVAQSVKDILQSLVDDGVIDTDKIGSGNFFWALPSKALNSRRVKIEAMGKEIEQLLSESESNAKTIADLEIGREDSDERKPIEGQLSALQQAIAECDERLNALDVRNPEKIQKMTNLVAESRDAVNRWTDNVNEVFSYLSSNVPGCDVTEVMKAVGMRSELEYVD